VSEGQNIKESGQTLKLGGESQSSLVLGEGQNPSPLSLLRGQIESANHAAEVADAEGNADSAEYFRRESKELGVVEAELLSLTESLASAREENAALRAELAECNSVIERASDTIDRFASQPSHADGMRMAYGKSIAHLRSLVPLMRKGDLRTGVETAIDELVEMGIPSPEGVGAAEVNE